MSASSDKTIKIWEVSSGKCMKTFSGHSSEIEFVVFSHDSTLLSSVSDDANVKIWDVSSDRCVHTLRGAIPYVESVKFSHDSTQLASWSSHYGVVQLWDVNSGGCFQTLELNISHRVQTMALSHDLTKLASAFSTRTWPRPPTFIGVWDVSNGACLQTTDVHGKAVYSMAFSHDSTRLAAAHNDSMVRIRDTSSGACLRTLSVDRKIRNVSFDPTDSFLRTNAGNIVVDSSEVLGLVGLAETQHCQVLGVGISLDGMWITQNGQNILRIPSEHRHSCYSMSGSTVGIGVGSGRVWICSVELPHAPGDP